MNQFNRINAILPLMAATFALAASAGAQQYSVTDLGTLAGPSANSGPGSQAYDLNDDGTVCGLSIDDSAQSDLHAILWDGSLIDLGVLGADIHSIAFAINNAGDSAGVTFTLGDLSPQAVRWIGISGAGLGTWAARDINDAGVIVGEQSATTSGAYDHAVRWISGSLLVLGTLGGLHSSAYAVDSGGRIVGMSFLANQTTRRAFLWQSGVMTDLGTLGGLHSHAYDISNSGYVVGIASRADGVQHAFRYTLAPNGSVLAHTDLGELAGGRSIAYAVNDAGDVVGNSDWRAFLWRNGAMTDLNSLISPGSGWELTHATAINNAGQIAGRGKLHGNDRAFLLTPAFPGDVNADGHVNIDDLLAVINSWGACPAPPTPCPADLNGNGTVNIDDLLLVINNWSP